MSVYLQQILFRKIWRQCYPWYFHRRLQSWVIHRKEHFLFEEKKTNLLFAIFRAAHSNLPLYQYIAKLSNSNIRLPVPAFNVMINK